MTTYRYKGAVLGIYAPNEDENALTKDEFYEKLNGVFIKVGGK
jgi:hypothetical protein